MSTMAGTDLTLDPLPTDQLASDQLGSAPANDGLPEQPVPTLLNKQNADLAAQADPFANYNPANPSAAPGTMGSLPANATVGDKIVQAAKHFLNVPYVWGGTGGTGVDCSGLVLAAYKAAGIDMPRISYQQANHGKKVALSALRPGDLVAWDNSTRNPGADHIAIYIGNGQYIEAARPGTNVRIESFSDYDKASAWGVQIFGGK